MSLIHLPEDLLTLILLAVIEDSSVTEYLILRQVCATFRRLCNNHAVLQRLSLHECHGYYHRRYPVLGSNLEARFHLAGHPEAICYEGKEKLITRPRDPTVGLALVNQAVIAGDSGAGYFMAMLRYGSNPADPEAQALLQGISGGLLPGGWWENPGLAALRGYIQKDLESIAYRLRLPHRYDPPELLVADLHVCIWVECRRFGDNSRPKFIRYCSAECRIRHEFDLWTRHLSGRVKYAVSKMILAFVKQE